MLCFDLLGSSSRNLRQMTGVPASRFMKNLRDILAQRADQSVQAVCHHQLEVLLPWQAMISIFPQHHIHIWRPHTLGEQETHLVRHDVVLHPVHDHHRATDVKRTVQLQSAWIFRVDFSELHHRILQFVVDESWGSCWCSQLVSTKSRKILRTSSEKSTLKIHADSYML